MSVVNILPGYSPVTVITCEDKLKNEEERDKAFSEASAATGSPRNRTHFISNYTHAHDECRPNTEKRAMDVLDTVLIAAERYVKIQKLRSHYHGDGGGDAKGSGILGIVQQGHIPNCVVVLCSAVSCCVVSYCVVLCCVVLCCDVLCCVASCCVVSCRVLPCCVVLCRVVSCRVCCVVSFSCCVVLCFVVWYRFVLCCVVSYPPCCVVLYCVVSCSVV